VEVEFSMVEYNSWSFDTKAVVKTQQLTKNTILYLGSQPPAQIEGGSRVFGGGKLLKNLINSL